MAAAGVAGTALSFNAGDTYTADSPLTKVRLAGVVLSAGVNPGLVILNDKADGSGSPLAQAILKSNVSLAIFPEGGFWCTGGCKLNASPALTVAAVYLMDEEG